MLPTHKVSFTTAFTPYLEPAIKFAKEHATDNDDAARKTVKVIHELAIKQFSKFDGHVNQPKHVAVEKMDMDADLIHLVAWFEDPEAAMIFKLSQSA